MYVRWKKRARTRRHKPTGEYTLTAVLVEAKRIDGKPRQQIVAYLGSIGSNRLGMYYHQLDFWQKATQALNVLDVKEEERSAIRHRLAVVVPIPNEEAKASAVQELQQITAKIQGAR